MSSQLFSFAFKALLPASYLSRQQALDHSLDLERCNRGQTISRCQRSLSRKRIDSERTDCQRRPDSPVNFIQVVGHVWRCSARTDQRERKYELQYVDGRWRLVTPLQKETEQSIDNAFTTALGKQI